jgi:hypothetical protein
VATAIETANVNNNIIARKDEEKIFDNLFIEWRFDFYTYKKIPS